MYENGEVPFFEEFIDGLLHGGDINHFDQDLRGNDSENGSALEGNVESLEFGVDIKLKSGLMIFNTNMKGGDCNKAYSLRVTDAVGRRFTIGTLRSGRKEDASSNTIVSIPYTTNEDGKAVFDYETFLILEQSDKNNSTSH